MNNNNGLFFEAADNTEGADCFTEPAKEFEETAASLRVRHVPHIFRDDHFLYGPHVAAKGEVDVVSAGQFVLWKNAEMVLAEEAGHVEFLRGFAIDGEFVGGLNGSAAVDYRSGNQ